MAVIPAMRIPTGTGAFTPGGTGTSGWGQSANQWTGSAGAPSWGTTAWTGPDQSELQLLLHHVLTWSVAVAVVLLIAEFWPRVATALAGLVFLSALMTAKGIKGLGGIQKWLL